MGADSFIQRTALHAGTGEAHYSLTVPLTVPLTIHSLGATRLDAYALDVVALVGAHAQSSLAVHSLLTHYSLTIRSLLMSEVPFVLYILCCEDLYFIYSYTVTTERVVSK